MVCDGSPVYQAVITSASSSFVAASASKWTHILDSLSASGFSGASIFSCQEVDLYSDFAPVQHYLAMKYEWLLALRVTVCQQVLFQRAVSVVVELQMVESQIDVDASDVSFFGISKQQLRHPSTNDDDVISVFTEYSNNLEHDASSSFNQVFRVITLADHISSITRSRSMSAASLPRPR